jgi:hypothetical protein
MKFLVFITLLVSGWYVLRWLQQFEANRRLHRQRPGGQRSANRQSGAASPRQMRATDTIVCSRCGTYVPSDFPTACDRSGCPFPGVG